MRVLGEILKLLFGFACLSCPAICRNPLSCDLMDWVPPVGFTRTCYQAAGGGLKHSSLASPRLLGYSAACALSFSELL